MLGAPSPRTPTHQNGPCGLNPGFPEHGLAEGIGWGSCQGCGRQAGVRRQPLQLPQQVPRHWEGAVTQAGPGGEPALQTGTTQHPLHPLDEGPLPHWSWSLLVCTCQPKLPSSCPGPCILVHDLQLSSSPTKPPLARSFPGDRPRGKMLQPQPPVLSARMLSWPRTQTHSSFSVTPCHCTSTDLSLSDLLLVLRFCVSLVLSVPLFPLSALSCSLLSYVYLFGPQALLLSIPLPFSR